VLYIGVPVSFKGSL